MTQTANSPESGLHAKRISEIAILGVLLLVCLIVRAIYLNQYFRALPDASVPMNDARMYWEMSREIYLDGWLLPDEGPYYQAPLYPYVLALFHHGGIHRVEDVLRMQSLLGLLPVLLTYGIVRSITSIRASVGAALLVGLCHYSLFFESKILATSLGTSMFLLFAWTYLQWLKTARLFWLIPSAWIYSLSVLCCANLVFALPFILLHLAGSWKNSISEFHTDKNSLQRRLLRSGLFLGIFILGILPVTLRNVCVGWSFVPISANSGVTLYMGTNDRAQGGLAPVEGLSNDISKQKQGSIELASRLSGRDLTPSEASSFWIHKTITWIKQNPIRFLILEGKKLLWAFYTAAPAVNYSAHFEGQRIFLLQAFSWITSFTLWFGLAGIPFLFTNRTRQTSFLLCLLAGYILLSLVFYASDRFLSSTLPIFATIGIVGYQRFRQFLHETGFRNMRWHVLWIVLSAGLALNPSLAWNAQREIGMGWYNLGVFYHEQNQSDEALQAYKNASDILTDFPPLLLNLGVLYAERGDLEKSTSLFERVLQIDPANPTARKNLLINRNRQNSPG